MEPDERMHLYRGAPGVRNWSRYKATERSWALCGRRNSGRQLLATEDASLVTCPFCCDLMQSKSYDRPAKAVCEARRNAPCCAAWGSGLIFQGRGGGSLLTLDSKADYLAGPPSASVPRPVYRSTRGPVWSSRARIRA
jgi:hypothetical protein